MPLRSRMLVLVLLLLLASGIISQADETSSNHSQPATESFLDPVQVSTLNPAQVLDPNGPVTENDQQESIKVLADKLSMSEAVGDSENACHLVADPGPCTAEQVRFFFDFKSQRCRQFIYGGCEGNQNQFVTEDECLQTCLSEAKSTDQVKYTNSNISEIATRNNDISQNMLTLANGNGETSFTFSDEFPFIQLTALDITGFNIRLALFIYIHRRLIKVTALATYIELQV